MSQPDSEVSDATQRVYVDKVSPASAVRRPSAGTGSRPTAQQRSAALANKKKKEEEERKRKKKRRDSEPIINPHHDKSVLGRK